MIDISELAKKLDLLPEDLKPYGKWIAKIDLRSVKPSSSDKRGKLVLVTAVTPTPAGEGKTVTTIGLSMGLNLLGHRSIACLRQPSLGPVFGVKGGATGGGKSTIEPEQDINLRFTGDIDSVASAHNLLSAMLDNHLFHGNSLGIDIHSVIWKRTVDMDDRSLRNIVVGLGAKSDGVPRQDGFIITAASEVMAVLCIARNYADLKERLGRIIIGYTKDGLHAIRASDLSAQGSMTAILKHAMEPNLVQTIEGTPAVVHGGPFGNVALGTCSITSILFALSHSDYVVVEAGFATDLGGEKFFDVVSQVGHFNVDTAVIVASVRALLHHGQVSHSDTKSATSEEDQRKLQLVAGLENLAKHIENIRIFGVEPVIAINRFTTDTAEEIEIIENFCKDQGVSFAISDAFEKGGAGCADLAEQVIAACEKSSPNRLLYSFQESIQSKIEKIVKKIYGGDGVQYTPEALKGISRIEKLGLSNLPICMAKTQLSLSDDPKKLGRPRGFTSTVRSVDIAAGAGFIIVDLGDIVAMPGLPEHPAGERIDLDENGNITGV